MKPAIVAMTALMVLSACQSHEAAPGVGVRESGTSRPGAREFTQTTMMEFQVTSPPRGIAAPPQGIAAPPLGIAAPPQGIAAPPQGIAAPPLGIATPLERSHFERFDSNGDGGWNQTEVGAYAREWRALSQGFATQAISLELSAEGLLNTYDRNHDGKLDYDEARRLHAGLYQLYLQTHAEVGVSLSAGPVSADVKASAAVNTTVNTTVSTVGSVLPKAPAPSPSPSASPAKKLLGVL